MFDTFETLRQQIEKKIRHGIDCGGVHICEDRNTITVTVQPPSSFAGAAGVQKILRNEGFSSDYSGKYVFTKRIVHELDKHTVNISEFDFSKINSLETKVFIKSYMDNNGDVDVTKLKCSLEGIIKGIKEDIVAIDEVEYK